jgi:hypothetical protein
VGQQAVLWNDAESWHKKLRLIRADYFIVLC